MYQALKAATHLRVYLEFDASTLRCTDEEAPVCVQLINFTFY